MIGPDEAERRGYLGRREVLYEAEELHLQPRVRDVVVDVVLHVHVAVVYDLAGPSLARAHSRSLRRVCSSSTIREDVPCAGSRWLSARRPRTPEAGSRRYPIAAPEPSA